MVSAPASLRHLRDHGRRAGAGAAAHARGDEHHLAAADGLEQLVAALFGGAQAASGVAADAEALRHLVADADLHFGRRCLERLRIRIDGDELHAGDLLGDHAAHGVAAATSDANDLDWRQPVRICPAHDCLPLLLFSPEFLDFFFKHDGLAVGRRVLDAGERRLVRGGLYVRRVTAHALPMDHRVLLPYICLASSPFALRFVRCGVRHIGYSGNSTRAHVPTRRQMPPMFREGRGLRCQLLASASFTAHCSRPTLVA